MDTSRATFQIHTNNLGFEVVIEIVVTTLQSITDVSYLKKLLTNAQHVFDYKFFPQTLVNIITLEFEYLFCFKFIHFIIQLYFIFNRILLNLICYSSLNLPTHVVQNYSNHLSQQVYPYHYFRIIYKNKKTIIYIINIWNYL